MEWQTLFIVGQFEGVDSITAVSVGSQVMHMLTVMIVGLAMGSTVVIGKAVGARKKQETACSDRKYGSCYLWQWLLVYYWCCFWYSLIP